ncbi:MAG: protein kinase domain-containing protein [Gemmatimonadales bacterium]
MDPTRWQQVESICFAALEKTGAERRAYLDQACAGDAELRREVDSLLASLEAKPDFLVRPMVDLSGFAESSPNPAEPLPERIGPYRLLRRVGRGGMGEVYLALRETEDLQQKVALKVIRRGMDTEDVLNRFRLERRILATLHHPNIAQFLDAAATPDGRPYFVMEYVEGLPLDEYCDGRRMPVAERLRLFRVICAAVQHAHQNLVIHRDIKPRNIVVTEDGVPKLLDFGIGKVIAPTEALSPGTETRTNVRVLTPEYAAPEQIAARAITTATDVYGLGVLLYELLTGRHPYSTGSESQADIERAVLEAMPSRPSEVVGTPEASARRNTDPAELRRTLAGDLDTIVLKAIRKEPERRYPSAAALADDIQRYLDGLPVSARPDTFGYRARKFVRRNAAWVATGATVFLALAATTVVTLVQSGRVARESARVASERDKALEVRSFLMEMFGATGAGRAVGDTVTARRLLDLQAASLDQAYADRPELKAEMMEVLADGYDRLGLYQVAEPLARQSLELRRRMLRADHPDLATSLNLFGWVTHELGRYADAEPLLREAVAIRRAGGPERRRDLSRSLNDLGVVLNARRNWPAANSVLAEALAIRREEFGDEHRSVGVTANNLAAAYYFQKRFDEAIATQDLALRALQKAVGPEHQRTIVALSNLAAFKGAKGDWQAPVVAYRDLLERQTRLQGPDHPRTIFGIMQLATALLNAGRPKNDRAMLIESEALFRDVIERYSSTLSPTYPELGTAWHGLARVDLALGKNREALEAARRAVGILRSTQGDTARSTIAAQRLVDSLMTNNAR